MTSKLRKRGEMLGGPVAKVPELLRMANAVIYQMELGVGPLQQQIKDLEYRISGRGRWSDAGGATLSDEEVKKAKEIQKEIKAFISMVGQSVDKVYNLSK